MNFIKDLLKGKFRFTYGNGVNKGYEVKEDKHLEDIANMFFQLQLFINTYEEIAKGNSARTSTK